MENPPLSSPGELETAFYEASSRSSKLSSYFYSYESLLQGFRNRDVTLIEIGILDGGSLEMWQKYLGPKARIVGFDLSQDAVDRAISSGFEAYVVDQHDKVGLARVIDDVGPFDILVDDGAHTNFACFNVLVSALSRIRSGGKIIFEDTHTSFLASFGNPASTSIFSVAVQLSRKLSEQYNLKRKVSSRGGPLSRIESITFCRSMVCFSIGEQTSLKAPKSLSNTILSEGVMNVKSSRDWGVVELVAKAIPTALKPFFRRLRPLAPKYVAISAGLREVIRNISLRASVRRFIHS